MLAPDVLVGIGELRRQELMREREHDRLVAQVGDGQAIQWRRMLAQGLYALAARIEPATELQPINATGAAFGAAD